MTTLRSSGAAQSAADDSLAPSEREGPLASDEESPQGGATATMQVGSPFFADLVRAHYAWERELARTNGAGSDRLDELRQAYEQKLAMFSAAEGDIVEAYWCIHKASAVALTEVPQRRRDRMIGDQRIRLHRVSNWLMPRSAQRVSDLLQDCDALAIRAEEILRGTPKRIALRSMYEVESHVLAFLERTRERPTKAEIDEFVADGRDGIRWARQCYQDAADKVARMVYVSGMLGGILALIPIAALTGVAIWFFGALHLHSGGTQVFFACLAAGALGALVSVLSRMASPGKFDLDPEVGRRALLYLGMYRPLVGSVFGLVLYFLLKSSLLEVTPRREFATFIVAAFLGGFSERFVKVMIHGAEGALTARPGASGDPPRSAPHETDRDVTA